MSFFDSDQNFAALIAEAQSWKGTKFVEHMAVKGVGVDCVRFAERCLVAVNAIQPIQFPPYVIRGGGEPMLARLIDCMDRVPEMERVWPWRDPEMKGKEVTRQTALYRLLKRGDILIVSSGKALHHLVIVGQPPQAWHALFFVDEASIFDPVLRDHVCAIYRVT